MAIDTALYRIRIEFFVMAIKTRSRVCSLCVSKRSIRVCLCLAIFLSMLMLLGGDVETNPGLPRSQKQRTLSFAETVARPTETTATPASAWDAQLNTNRSIQDIKVM
ncbi:hypothetical protein DPMN_041659 [Dreissena polymorpha]|uniref:Uncharacterized protein n=1 Tax=Dreissena polymorpha TaxID=45954 RepID=A0A9D4CXM5_DREPO|nr:hypothetical protein DPMN_041659 [Dreissena polymorpha]